jgi:hypothetical protein
MGTKWTPFGDLHNLDKTCIGSLKIGSQGVHKEDRTFGLGDARGRLSRDDSRS